MENILNNNANLSNVSLDQPEKPVTINNNDDKRDILKSGETMPIIDDNDKDSNLTTIQKYQDQDPLILSYDMMKNIQNSGTEVLGIGKNFSVHAMDEKGNISPTTSYYSLGMALDDKIRQYQKLNLMGPQAKAYLEKGYDVQLLDNLLKNPDNSNNP